MKEVFLMRHGLTKENELRRVMGSSDPSLSDKGKAELYLIKEYVVRPDIIFCSDLKRAVETAEILFPNTETRYLPELRERCYGVLEGKTMEYMRKSGLTRIEDADILKKNGIESPTSLLARANLVIHLMNKTQAQRIMVVSHGGFINFLMTLLSENGQGDVLANSHYHKIVLDSNGRIIDVKMNQSWLN